MHGVTDQPRSVGGASDLLPEGTRLLHIGPPKTATTAVQAGFHASRDELLKQGVRYAGSKRHTVDPVLAVTGRKSSADAAGQPPPIEKWDRFLDEIRSATEPRVVISSEFFADAPAAAIERVASDLDASRLHVVVTLRPIARIIPSQWQQYVQSGLQAGFDEWLDAMFNQPPGDLTPSFWHRHRHDELVRRWASVVGADSVTVVVVDDDDRGMVLRSFERLVGLRAGTLPAEEDLTNRSMSLPETELVRAFNRRFKAEGLETPLHLQVMRYGAALYIKEREIPPGEPRVELPEWAARRSAELGAEMAAAIRQLGVRVIGDLDRLADRPARAAAPDGTAVNVSPELAGRAAVGVLLAMLQHRTAGARRLRRQQQEGSAEGFSHVPTRILLREIARRLRSGPARK